MEQFRRIPEGEHKPKSPEVREVKAGRLEKPPPQQEGVVNNKLTRILSEMGNNLTFAKWLSTRSRREAEMWYKEVPSSEELVECHWKEERHLKTLTPKEQDQYFKERYIRKLKNYRHTESQLKNLEFVLRPDYVAEFQQLDPEFMDPLISALRQRPKWQKKEKAFERLQRMRQRRMKDHPQGSDDRRM